MRGGQSCPQPPFRRLFGLGANSRTRPAAGWKAGGSHDWLPHFFATQQCCYAVRMVSDLSPEMAACAAASRAIGTRYGEQET